jgi:hypothetical protein
MTLTTWLPDSNLFEMFKVMKLSMAPPPSPAPPSPFEWLSQSGCESFWVTLSTRSSSRALPTTANRAASVIGDVLEEL